MAETVCSSSGQDIKKIQVDSLDYFFFFFYQQSLIFIVEKKATHEET